MSVQIPSQAVSSDGDIGAPTKTLLEQIRLIGSDTDTAQASSWQAAIQGPPQSVALIEAGATAAAKWWAAGLGVSAIAAWGTILTWWGQQSDNLKMVVVGGAALFTATLVWSIGFLIASDVRGRAAATVAAINSRSRLGEAMVEAARQSYRPASASAAPQVVPLPTALSVRATSEPKEDEDNWRAIALFFDVAGEASYLIVKDSRQKTVSVDDLIFEPFSEK